MSCWRSCSYNDGAIIAFDRAGHGPALILVGGAFEQPAMESETAKLAAFPLLMGNSAEIELAIR